MPSVENFGAVFHTPMLNQPEDAAIVEKSSMRNSLARLSPLGETAEMTATQQMRPKRRNPFAGGSQNPFSSVDELQLVKVPDAPETHERRKPMRGYLSGSQGPLDNLFGMLDGKQPRPPQKIEVVRTEKAQAGGEDDDAPVSAGDGPPRYGSR